jgi:hypothetical protein
MIPTVLLLMTLALLMGGLRASEPVMRPTSGSDDPDSPDSDTDTQAPGDEPDVDDDEGEDEDEDEDADEEDAAPSVHPDAALVADAPDEVAPGPSDDLARQLREMQAELERMRARQFNPPLPPPAPEGPTNFDPDEPVTRGELERERARIRAEADMMVQRTIINQTREREMTTLIEGELDRYQTTRNKNSSVRRGIKGDLLDLLGRAPWTPDDVPRFVKTLIKRHLKETGAVLTPKAEPKPKAPAPEQRESRRSQPTPPRRLKYDITDPEQRRMRLEQALKNSGRRKT